MKTTRQTSRADQLDLFGAPTPPETAREPRAAEDAKAAAWCAEKRAAVLACTRHGPSYVCVECMPNAWTDGLGFIHRHDHGPGKIPLRRCRECGELKTPGNWNHADYWRCRACVPLGSKKFSPNA